MSGMTYEAAQEAVRKLGYKILTPKEEFPGASENICCEKDGLKSWCSVSDITSKGNRVTSKRFFSMINPFIEENIRTYIHDIDAKTEVLCVKTIVKSKRKRILLTIRCSCGEVFNRLWDKAKSAKYAAKCPKCLLIERGKSRREDKSKALHEFERRHYKVVGDVSNFLRNVPVEVENEQGYRGFLSYNKMMAGHSFGIFDVRANKSNYIYNANIWAKNNGIGTIVLDFCDDKPYTQQGIKCRCLCGQEFQTSIRSFQSCKTRCDRCAMSMSKYEREVGDFLKQNDIEYIREYRISSCKDIVPLPFDFYIVSCGRLIEIDGQGHYKPCHFNQISYEDAQRSYESTVRHDAIKNEYCKKYEIPLLRIPYWEMDDGAYKEKIMQFIRD